MPVVQGTNLRMLRQYGSAGKAQIPHVQTPKVAGGGIPHAGREGGNPMAPRGTDEEGHLLPPLGRPGTVSGIIGRMMDKADIADYNANVDKKSADKSSKIQAGIDAYAKNLQESGGDKNQALIKTFSPDEEGHVHFTDPDVFNAIGTFHKNMTGSGEWGIKSLGSGYSVIQGPGGEASVVPDKSVAAGKVISGPGGSKMEVVGRDPQTGQMITRPIQGMGTEDRPYDKATPAQFDAKVSAVGTILRNVDTLAQNVGATGALGWGKLERFAARSTPFSPQQAGAYNAAYDQLQGSLLQLTRVPGFRDKATAESLRAQLPKPDLATPYLLSQSIPQIRDLARHSVAQSYTEAKGGHLSAFPTVNALATTYEAQPALMDRLDDIKQKLQTAPGTISPSESAVLQHEFSAGRLTGTEQENAAVVMAQHGRLTADQLTKLSQAYPGIAQKFQDPTYAPADPSWKKPLPPEPATTPQPITPPEQVPPPPAKPVPPEATPTVEPSGNPPEVQAPPPGSPGLVGAAQGALNTLNPQPVEAAPRQPPLGAPAEAPTQPPPSAGAPIPPAATPTQPPGQQSSLLDALNPIGSAQAAETPTQPPYDALRTTAVPEAGDQQPEASASAPIPPRNPIGESASAPIPQPGFEDKATALFNQIHDLLSQYKQDQ